MGLQKIAFNFMVERGGKFAKSLLCSKPQKVVMNTIGLKYAPVLEKDTVQLSQTVGKHKIPRYLYHMTSLENYQKMLETGYIRPSGARLPDGVYMLELDSFSKYWNKSLRNDLCDLVFRSGESPNIVMLRIPTKNLEASKIRLRTQKQVEGNFYTKEIAEWLNICHMPPERKQLCEDLLAKYGKKEGLNRYIELLPKKFEPVTKGIDAKLTPLYKQKKSDLEFIYRGEIPMSDVELVSQYNYEKEIGTNYNFDSDERNLCKTIFEKIFRGKPEEPFLKAWRE